MSGRKMRHKHTNWDAQYDKNVTVVVTKQAPLGTTRPSAASTDASTGEPTDCHVRRDNGKKLRISPSRFYREPDPRWKEVLETLRKGASRSNALPIAPTEDLRKYKPPSIWREFGRQNDAFTFRQESRHPLHIFSYEIPSAGDGRRRFIAAGYQAFWTRYKDMKESDRHFYEVLPEGAPCKLYFDLEYKREECPGYPSDFRSSNVNKKDSDLLAEGDNSITEAFIDVVIKELRFQFKDMKHSPDRVLDLDSGTLAKYSRHIIFLDAVFEDNVHAGAFVSGLVSKLERNVNTYGSIVPTNKFGCRKAFVDTGVYTRNRNFRLWLSSKLNKNVSLVTSKRNLYKAPSQEALFLASLICHVPTVRSGAVLRIGLLRDTSRQSVRRNSNGPSSTMSRSGYRRSQYPDMDDFIIAVASARGQNTAVISRWAYFEQSKTIVYDIGNNRFCERMGREHKSNGVYYIVNIERGVFYQKCHDPDCQALDFKSEIHSIPACLLPNDLDDDDDADWEKWLASSVTSEMLQEIEQHKHICGGDTHGISVEELSTQSSDEELDEIMTSEKLQEIEQHILGSSIDSISVQELSTLSSDEELDEIMRHMS